MAPAGVRIGGRREIWSHSINSAADSVLIQSQLLKLHSCTLLLSFPSSPLAPPYLHVPLPSPPLPYLSPYPGPTSPSTLPPLPPSLPTSSSSPSPPLPPYLPLPPLPSSLLSLPSSPSLPTTPSSPSPPLPPLPHHDGLLAVLLDDPDLL